MTQYGYNDRKKKQPVSTNYSFVGDVSKEITHGIQDEEEFIRLLRDTEKGDTYCAKPSGPPKLSQSGKECFNSWRKELVKL